MATATAAAEIRELRHLVARLKARAARRSDAAAGAARHDWYAEGCPCGVPAGECRAHPRAYPEQRPPAGDWRTWLALAGRGGGKTRAGAEWIRRLAETGTARRLALVGPTAADVRDVMIEGKSGVLSIAPPSCRPHYEPSKRRLTWPNGAVATAYSADDPDQLRGPEHDAAWCDELAAWRRPEAWSNLLFGLRLGDSPRAMVTTTPRNTEAVKALVEDPRTAVVRWSSHRNRRHLAPDFFERIVSTFEGTRLGRQEIYAEILETSEGAWFRSFDPAKHLVAAADYEPGYPVYLAIDCGVSRHVAAVWFQVRPLRPLPFFEVPTRIEAVMTPGGWVMPPSSPPRRVPDASPRETVCVFGDFHVEGLYSEAAALAIRAHAGTLPGAGGIPDYVRLDPAAKTRTGIGPTAFGEFQRVFGQRVTEHWPAHRVLDGLDQVEVRLDAGTLLLHPRCERLKDAFQNYRRAQRNGRWLDEPEQVHPYEDLMDALRGGIRSVWPEGRIEQPRLRRTHA